MKKHYIWQMQYASYGFILFGMVLILAACQAATPEPTLTPQPTATSKPTDTPQPTATTAPSPTPLPELTGDPLRGGQLYDSWWAVTGAERPTTDQSLWGTQTTNTRTGADTWRCKECHGWDYKGKDGAYGSGSHLTGFPGIFATRDRPPFETLAILKGSTNPDHDFSTVMDEQSLIDLALFVTQAQIDMAELVNADKTIIGGNADQGKVLYEDVCLTCHGPGGAALNFGDAAEPEYVGTIAADNPWEFLHKVLFGQPDSVMTSAFGQEFTKEELANLLAYAQTLPTVPSLSLGGQLYDSWWTVTGAEAPTTDQPLWATQTTNTRTGADTWRCKECHGWDYKGVEGAYGSGSHMTGIKGILAAASLTAEELMARLKGEVNPMHDFSAALSDYELSALVAFIQQGQVDTAAYINADKTANGDAATGKAQFDSTCVVCHGEDGKQINFGSADEPEYVGTIAADNPWEFFHKVLFGQPGAEMPAGVELGWTLEDIANLLAFAQSLPTE
jgi:thiosulfate dehydrogenase